MGKTFQVHDTHASFLVGDLVAVAAVSFSGEAAAAASVLVSSLVAMLAGVGRVNLFEGEADEDPRDEE